MPHEETLEGYYRETPKENRSPTEPIKKLIKETLEKKNGKKITHNH